MTDLLSIFPEYGMRNERPIDWFQEETIEEWVTPVNDIRGDKHEIKFTVYVESGKFLDLRSIEFDLKLKLVKKQSASLGDVTELHENGANAYIEPNFFHNIFKDVKVQVGRTDLRNIIDFDMQHDLAFVINTLFTSNNYHHMEQKLHGEGFYVPEKDQQDADSLPAAGTAAAATGDSYPNSDSKNWMKTGRKTLSDMLLKHMDAAGNKVTYNEFVGTPFHFLFSADALLPQHLELTITFVKNFKSEFWATYGNQTADTACAAGKLDHGLGIYWHEMRMRTVFKQLRKTVDIGNGETINPFDKVTEKFYSQVAQDRLLLKTPVKRWDGSIINLSPNHRSISSETLKNFDQPPALIIVGFKESVRYGDVPKDKSPFRYTNLDIEEFTLKWNGRKFPFASSSNSIKWPGSSTTDTDAENRLIQYRKYMSMIGGEYNPFFKDLFQPIMSFKDFCKKKDDSIRTFFLFDPTVNQLRQYNPEVQQLAKQCNLQFTLKTKKPFGNHTMMVFYLFDDYVETDCVLGEMYKSWH